MPFIQVLNPEAKILPLILSSSNVNNLVQAGEEIARLVNDNPEVLLVASTDMSHFIDAEHAHRQDYLAINEINRLNPQGLFEVVQKNRITMCGVGPTTTMLSAARRLGATQAEKIEYTNSGEVTGDRGDVVAYLSMLVY